MEKKTEAAGDRFYDNVKSESLSQGYFLAHPITPLPSILSICLLLGLPCICQLKQDKMNPHPSMNFGSLLPHPCLSVPPPPSQTHPACLSPPAAKQAAVRRGCCSKCTTQTKCLKKNTSKNKSCTNYRTGGTVQKYMLL